jgi:MFS family permease
MALSGGNLGLVSLAFLGADTVTNMGWGLAGDRFGFRSTFVVSLLVWIAATVLLAVAPHFPDVRRAAPGGLSLGVHWLIFCAFFGLGAAQSGFMMSSQTMVLEFGAREDIAMRLALTTTAQGAVSAIGPLAGGIIASSLGYGVLFGASIGFLVLALIVLVTLVDEPRFRGVA